MVISHSYVSLPEGTHTTSTEQETIRSFDQTWTFSVTKDELYLLQHAGMWGYQPSAFDTKE